MAFAYFECLCGISGDMTLGALIDLGADAAEIERLLKTTALKEFSLECERVTRGGLAAVKATVVSHEEHPPHRHLRHIEELLAGGELPERARERALRAFRLLAEAEAAAHDTTVEKVHFHEVGALDSIVDIAGVMVAAELLDIETAMASTVSVGGGVVQCDHGTLPVPAPAVARLLQGVPVAGGPVEKELTTPTGAAILRTLAAEFGPLPPMTIDRVGCGAGSRDFEERANCLRVLLGERAAGGAAAIAGLHRRRLELVATEIDDMSPEVYSHLMERLFTAGALDVHYQPLQMKKNRPGVRVEALCDPATTPSVLQLILEETSTFGARVSPVDRYCFDRRMETLRLPAGEVQVKLALRDGAVVKASPEYEDCRRLAEESGTPLRQILNQAARAIEDTYFS